MAPQFKLPWWAVPAVLLFLAPAAAAMGRAPAETGAVAGQVTRGPTAPAERAGGPPAWQPVPGAKIVIYGAGSQEAATVVTDPQGRYRAALPAGRYRVDMPVLPGRAFTKDLPAWVTVAPGQETRLDIRLDTGLR
jgi:hypothetical protein